MQRIEEEVSRRILNLNSLEFGEIINYLFKFQCFNNFIWTTIEIKSLTTLNTITDEDLIKLGLIFRILPQEREKEFWEAFNEEIKSRIETNQKYSFYSKIVIALSNIDELFS